MKPKKDKELIAFIKSELVNTISFAEKLRFKIESEIANPNQKKLCEILERKEKAIYEYTREIAELENQ